MAVIDTSDAELRRLIIDAASTKLVEEILNTTEVDGIVRTLVRTRVQETVDGALNAAAQGALEPILRGEIEKISLQRTNEWGEEKGEAITFVEYMTERAAAWIKEPVDSRGRDRSHRDYDNVYRKNGTTRIAFMIDEHLRFSIESAMENALKTANDSMVGGLKAAVVQSLNEIHARLKVTVKT
jgi:hypothetical protein